jgi:carboxymethylenebutenolidase
MIQFQANGHSRAGYLARPASGTGPGLMVIQEWWGLVDHIKSVADRFAGAGFVALAPDFYHGRSAKSPDEAGKLMMALNIAETAKDLRGAADYLLALEAVQPKKVGALGFCMGGQLALFAACEHGDRIAAAVDFYGIHPNVPIHPEKIAGSVQAHFGQQDAFVKEADARALVDKIQKAGKTVEAYFYDAGHAFFNDTRAEAYSKADADLAWQRTTEFLRKALG